MGGKTLENIENIENAIVMLKGKGWPDDLAREWLTSEEVFLSAKEKNLTINDYISTEILAGSFDPPGDSTGEDVALIPTDQQHLNPLSGDSSGDIDGPPAETRIEQEKAAPERADKQFKILGYSGENYYYFPYAKKQIVKLTPTQHNINNLLQLAPLNFWRDNYGAKDGSTDGKIALTASNELIKRATSKGIFDEAVNVRGCGAWLDAGRVVLHCGDRIYVDGIETDIKKIKSRFTYVAASRLLTPADEALSNAEAYKLRLLCEMPSWENKLSGSLLAGWLVIAPICACLSWRPHIWVTGQAGSGKSTVMEDIIQRALGDMALQVDGGTTEPAIRSLMRYDARPVVYDEAEEGHNKTVMMGVMALVRLASKGGRVSKFGQNPFIARFATCFSGIRPPIREFADETRISLLKLKENRSATAADDFKALLLAIEDTLTDGFSSRMLTRLLRNLPVLLKNIEIFKVAAKNVLRGARASDQIAPMLAGLFFLHGTSEVTLEKAEDFVRQQDWSYHTAIKEDNDSVRCLQRLSTYCVSYNPNNGTAIQVSIGNMIEAVLGVNQDIKKEWADKTLRNFSIIVKHDGVTIANRSQALEKAFKDTPWSVGWKGAFEAIEGAKKRSAVYFGAANKQNAVEIPISMFTDGG